MILLLLLWLDAEPLTTQLMGIIIAGTFTALGTISLLAWKSIRDDVRYSREYTHRSTILLLRLLADLHPDKEMVINQALIDFMKFPPSDNYKFKRNRERGD